jgi:3-hydroxyisobutyrate dehydrogenase-like beta-hydroxyacid dehydrogenase
MLPRIAHTRHAREHQITFDTSGTTSRNEEAMKIGFVGLGNMGAAMARNLIKAGHQLTIYNRTRSRADELAAAGAVVRDSPGRAAEGAEVVITMLADDHALESVVFASGNILDTLPANAIHISMSTISVALSRRLATAHRERKQTYVAAPVFGRPEAAAAATLFIVAAGPSNAVERCHPLFDVMGQKTFTIGEDPAAANVIKLTGNFLITTVIEGLAESFALVRKSGIDGKQFLDLLTNSLFNAPIYKTYGGLIAAEKFSPAGFKLPLGAKDNRLLLAAAEEKSVPMPMASLVRDRFLSAMAQGLSESDWSAIAQISAKEAGL